MKLIEWLLDADPAICWQVMRDLTDAAPAEVAAERSRVALEGYGDSCSRCKAPMADGTGGPTGRAGSMSRSRSWQCCVARRGVASGTLVR